MLKLAENAVYLVYTAQFTVFSQW